MTSSVSGGTLTYSFTSDGIVFDIVVTDLGDGRFSFDVSINMDASAQIGDIRAFYFDIEGDVDTMGLSIEGTTADSVASGLYDVALDDTYVIDEADVKSVESRDTNMNGEVKGSDLFDVGVEFGDQGMAHGDDFQSVSFIIAGAEELTLEDFNMQSIGVRLTSVGAIDGSRGASLKISDQTDGEINHPPLALDDAITIAEDGAIAPAATAAATEAGTEPPSSLNILVNDSDPDGDPITITTVGGLPPGAALDVVTTGGVATTVMVTAEGDLVFATDGAFDHLAAGETDSFQLTYSVADPDGETSQATVTVTIVGEEEVNQPPVALDDEVTILESGAVGVEGGEGVTASLNILDNDSDPDGDALTITSIGGGAAPGESIAVTTANGVETTVTITAEGDVIFQTNEAFDALGLGEFDRLTLDYTVDDGNGGSDAATVTINIVGEEGPAVSTVSYNIMFMVDMSGSALTGGTLGAMFGEGDALDQNGDGYGGTEADAALLAIRSFQEALQGAGLQGDVDIGVGTFSWNEGDTEEYKLLTNGDQIVFDLGEDVSSTFGQAATGGDTAFLGSPFAAANEFFAAAGGADENVVNLFYVFSDGLLSIGTSEQVDNWVAEMNGTFANYDPRTTTVGLGVESGGVLGQVLGQLTAGTYETAALYDNAGMDAWLASEMSVLPDLGDVLIG